MSVARADRVLLLLAVLAVAVALAFGFLSVAPNRLVSGRPLPLRAMAGAEPGFTLTAVALAGLLIAAWRGTRWTALVAACLLVTGVMLCAGGYADMIAETRPAARVSFGASFWVLFCIGLLATGEAARRIGRRAALPAVLLVLVPMALLLESGALDGLSVLREYQNQRDVLGPAVLRHLMLVLGGLLPTLLIGVPLGIACQRRPVLARQVFPVLGVVQTVPSIALFGLLMAPLSGLAVDFPVLQRLGISGIGAAPAIIALVLYSLLPITRNTAAGLDGVPEAVRDAAAGMGMTGREIFRMVEIPLALPVFLAGLRVTIVQAIGLAAVAALIGAGGLGAVMFQGLFANALDLVLLGAVPVIALAVAADVAFRLVQARLA